MSEPTPMMLALAKLRVGEPVPEWYNADLAIGRLAAAVVSLEARISHLEVATGLSDGPA